jgi:hypothetical protein
MHFRFNPICDACARAQFCTRMRTLSFLPLLVFFSYINVCAHCAGLHAQRKFFAEMSADDLERVYQRFRTDFMLFSYDLNFYDNK